MTDTERVRVLEKQVCWYRRERERMILMYKQTWSMHCYRLARDYTTKICEAEWQLNDLLFKTLDPTR